MKIYGSIILVSGFVGNTLSFITFWKDRGGRKTTRALFLTLAVTDNLNLCTGALGLYIVIAFNFSIFNISTFSCRVFAYFGYIFNGLSIYTMIAITLERFLLVYYPTKCEKFNKTKTIAIYITAVILFNMVFYIPRLLMRFEKNSHGNFVCHSYIQDSYTIIFNWVDNILMLLHIYVGILLLTILIFARVRRQLLQVQPKGLSASSRKSLLATKTVLALAVYLVITMTPYNIYYFLNEALMLFESDWDTSRGSIKQSSILFTTVFIYYSNYAINFYTYCLVSSRFRQKVRELLLGECEGARNIAAASTAAAAAAAAGTLHKPLWRPSGTQKTTVAFIASQATASTRTLLTMSRGGAHIYSNHIIMRLDHQHVSPHQKLWRLLSDKLRRDETKCWALPTTTWTSPNFVQFLSSSFLQLLTSSTATISTVPTV